MLQGNVKQFITRGYISRAFARGLPLHIRTCILLLITAVLISGHPLMAQRVKEAGRVDGSSGAKREKQVNAPENRQRTVRETNQAGERARKGAEAKPRAVRNVKKEEETRKKHETRKALPIIEGRKRDREIQKPPERVRRERLHDNEPVQRKRAPEAADRRVRDTLERFRKDWVNGDSRALTDLLSDKSRVKITIESKDINDSFGRGQAQYVLKEYLSSADARNMSFSRFRVSSSDGRSAYGVGRLQMRDRKTGKIVDHTVFVSMAREGDNWAVREIRITE